MANLSPNLKIDLLGKLNNDKFYEELELVRLAAEPNMKYKDKIELMSVQLEQIALINAKLKLVEEQYFKEPASPPQVPVNAPNSPAGQASFNGQSHGE